jgi:hypothetical protein
MSQRGDAIHRLRVYPRHGGGSFIHWEYRWDFVPTGDFTITVQRSPSGIGNWVTVGQVSGGIGDLPSSLNDNEKVNRSPFGRWFYRAVYDCGDIATTTQAEPAWGSLPKADWLVAREIARREQRRLEKTTAGTQGLLLKRMHYGAPCNREGCLNPDTGDVSSPDCRVCFGTGFVGGYYGGSAYWVDFSSGEDRNIQNNPQVGTIDDRTRYARGLACPLPITLDVWADADGDKRYYVHRCWTLAEIRSVPLVLRLELKLAPPSDVAYQLNLG